LLELSRYSQLIIALVGNALRGSLAAISDVEDFWSKVEIVGWIKELTKNIHHIHHFNWA